MFRKISFAVLMGILALFSLVNGTGLGQSIASDTISRCFLYGLTVIYIFLVQPRNKKITDLKEILFVLLLFAAFEGVSLFTGYAGDGLMYLSFFLCTFLVYMQHLTVEKVQYAAYVFGGFSVFILLVVTYTSVLDGWNPNTLSILCFQAYLLFFACHNTKSGVGKIVYAAVFCIVFLLIRNLDSRSALLGMIAAVLLGFRSAWVDKLLQKKAVVFIFLIMPLLVSLAVANANALPFVENLNRWSLANFQKTIFNGRDTIWQNGYHRLLESPILGHGEIYSGYWHNSAVACLYSYGVLGYALYVSVLYRFVASGTRFVKDAIVRRSMLAFLLLNIQQSFENTLFVPSGIYFPYILLGILLGRIRYLKGRGGNAALEHHRANL